MINMTDTADMVNMADMVINMANMELFVDKTFQNWEYVANFMKKYIAIKGYRI